MYKKLLVSTILLIVFSLICYSIFEEINRLHNDTSQDSYDSHHVDVNQQKIPMNAYEKHISQKCVVQSSTPNRLIGHATIVEELESIAHLWSNTTTPSNPLYKPPTGILLYGPPGTGKTTLSKHISEKLLGGNVSFMNVSSDTFDNKYQGEGLKYLRAVFTLAVKLSPCVIFFDEVDGFMSKRSDTEQTHVNGMKTTFLSGMDYINEHDRVLVVCATNRPECLDDALMRRMEIHFHTGFPSLEDKCLAMSDFEPLKQDVVYKFVKETLPNTATLHDIQTFLRFCVRRESRITEWNSITLEELYNEYKSAFKFVRV